MGRDAAEKRRQKRHERRVQRREEKRRVLDKPTAFAPLERTAKRDAAEKADASARQVAESAPEGGKGARLRRRPKANRVIAVLIIGSLAVSVAQVVLQVFFSKDDLVTLVSGTANAPAIVSIVYFALVSLNVLGLVMVIVCDHKGKVFEARLITRVLVVLLVAGLLVFVALNGIRWTAVFYLFQFVCVIAYQVYNDPNLSRPPRFANPFKDGGATRMRVYELDPEHRGYIPLNFFNLFWIFIVASVIGLCMEMVFCLLVNGVWEDRAGLLWGPLSPIYGVGAVLMTVALNRWWYRNIPFIFVVAGFIGAAFEFFVSWYMQTAFGVVAWDYSGTFLSVQGRTDFAHFCAWGLLGVLWIRLILPELMRIVDLIPLRWRALVTVLALAFMVVNVVMTLLALDCWSQRVAGVPVQDELQRFFAAHFDDQFMQTRFSTMGMSQESALHAQAGAQS